jgi:hypothetical protein
MIEASYEQQKSHCFGCESKKATTIKELDGEDGQPERFCFFAEFPMSI